MCICLSHRVWSFWDDLRVIDVDRTWMLKSSSLHVLWQVRLDESNILFAMQLPFFSFFLKSYVTATVYTVFSWCLSQTRAEQFKQKCWLLHTTTLNLTSLLMLYSCESLWEFWAISVAVCLKTTQEKKWISSDVYLVALFESFMSLHCRLLCIKCGYICYIRVPLLLQIISTLY